MPGLNFLSKPVSLGLKITSALRDLYNCRWLEREGADRKRGFFVFFNSFPLGRTWLQGPHIAFEIRKQKYLTQGRLHADMSKWTESFFERLDFSRHKMENHIGKRQSYR